MIRNPYENPLGQQLAVLVHPAGDAVHVLFLFLQRCGWRETLLPSFVRARTVLAHHAAVVRRVGVDAEAGAGGAPARRVRIPLLRGLHLFMSVMA